MPRRRQAANDEEIGESADVAPAAERTQRGSRRRGLHCEDSNADCIVATEQIGVETQSDAYHAEKAEKAERAGGRKKGGGGNKGSSKNAPLGRQITCVALKCHTGKHVKAEPNGSMRASSAVVGEAEKFIVVHHEGETVSFRASQGKYVSVNKTGELRADATEPGDRERFELQHHADGTVSLKSCVGFVAAEQKGGLRANRAAAGLWEKFHMKDRSSKPVRDPALDPDAAKDAAEEVQAAQAAKKPEPPLFDVFCELEHVLRAEESYARSHSDRTALAYEKRVRARRAQGLELSFQHFREEHSYPDGFKGCISAWDATRILMEQESVDEVEGDDESEVKSSRLRSSSTTSDPGRAANALAWREILAQGPGLPTVSAAFGIPAASAAEADEAAFERLEALCRGPHCAAVGPVGLDLELPAQVLEEMCAPKEEHRGLNAAAFEKEFGVGPDASYDPRRDPHCVAWLASGPGLQAEIWMTKHGDRRMKEFAASRMEYMQRRLEAQVMVAERQVQLAQKMGLPLVVQLPPQDEAERRMAELLVAVLGDGSDHPVLLSAFRGRPRCVAALMKHFPGLVVGFSGLLTHAKLRDTLGEVAFDTPLDRLVLESLGPRFPPATSTGVAADSRGSYSHPAHISEVAIALADVKRLSPAEVFAAAWANSRRTFRLPEVAVGDAVSTGIEVAG